MSGQNARQSAVMVAPLRIDNAWTPHYCSAPLIWGRKRPPSRVKPMKIRNSLKSLKGRDKDCRVVRRKGRVYVINKKNPRFKARQG